VGDTVCELAAGILEDGGWPELLPFLFASVQSGPDALRESALLIFAQLALYVGASMAPYLPTLRQGAQAPAAARRARGRLRACALAGPRFGPHPDADRGAAFPFLPPACAVLQQFMSAGGTLGVRVAALRAAVSLVCALEEPSQRKELQARPSRNAHRRGWR
jgi:hypothetical protein